MVAVAWGCGENGASRSPGESDGAVARLDGAPQSTGDGGDTLVDAAQADAAARDAAVADGGTVARDGGSTIGLPDGGRYDAGTDRDCMPLDLGATPVSVTLPSGCGGDGCTRVGFTPLTELGRGDYHGMGGGLYCNGANERPAQHDSAGLTLARGIGPLDATGRPDPAGKYVFLSIGMSNTAQEFIRYARTYGGAGDLDPSLVIVNGAYPGQASAEWARGTGTPWDNLDTQLAAAGVTRAQVAVAWIKLARINPAGACRGGDCFPADADVLARDIVTTLRLLKERLPNLTLTYLSSRIYAGYAPAGLNPEPYAYQSAFAVKAIILDQITGLARLNHDAARGPVVASWLSWGPYLWADGTTGRGDGLVWRREDLQGDGTHPTDSGADKVAAMLDEFLRTDPTARQWYLAP